MVLETPLLKVSRPVAACSRCRAAKIKCDGKLPACSACEKTGKSAECASANDNFARGKERSYVSTLETRVEKLERRLQEARRRKSSTLSTIEPGSSGNGRPGNGQDQDSQDAAQHAPSAAVAASARAAKRKEARDIDEIVSDFGYLTVNATARDYRGFNSFMSYAKLILSACTKAKLPSSAYAKLPARQQARATIQHYIDHILALYPFLDDTSLYYSLDAVYNSMQDPNNLATGFDHWSVRMALAITNAYKSEQKGDQYSLLATGHVNAAIEHAEFVLLPGSIMSVQALLFLAQYSMVDPHHFDTWSLVGAASRAMVDLGLHADVSKDTKITRPKLELRRKVFYCVYMFDRTVAIVNTRCFSFSDGSFSVTNPFQPAPGSTKSTGGGSSWMNPSERAHDLLALRMIQSRWYYDLFQSGRDEWPAPYAYIWKTYQDLTSWFANLSQSTPQALRILFELDLCYSYVYILGPSCRNPRPHPYAQALLFHHCSTYAALLIRAVADRTQGVPLDFGDNMKAYMTGMQLLDVLVKSRDQIISGIAPEPPHPPEGPVHAPALPPLTTEANANLVKAITAIQQIKEALVQFGHRFGFMSWHDNFQVAVEPMLSALNSRMWELSQLDVNLRPGMYAHVSSSGSVGAARHVSRHEASHRDHQFLQQHHQQFHLPAYPSPSVTPPAVPQQQFARTAYDQVPEQQYMTTWTGTEVGGVHAPEHRMQQQSEPYGRQN